MATGSLNMRDVAQLLPELYHSKVVLTAGIFMVVGISLEMALYPLHAWAPNAYADAPSTVSALVAPLMTKVASYLMIRVMFTIFKPSFFIETIPVTTILTWMAAVAIILGSIYAIAQTDLKKMLSYSVVAQIGYIALGIGLANKYGLTGAVLHILNEALTKGCVFLVAGAIVYKMGACNIYDFKNLYRKMPFTMSAFLIGAFSMVGIPPTCGFFSKIYLIMGAIDAGKWIFVAVLLFSSILNVIYFFRVIQISTFETPMPDYGRDKAYESVRMDEVPLSMIIPIQVMAVGILLAGIFSSKIISTAIQFVIPVGF
jgi:multicomponent Na+:H+ antiporter subunit D